MNDPLLDDNDRVEPPEHLLNPSPYRLPMPSSTEDPIMSGEGEISGFYSSPSADEMSKGRAKASKSAADVTNQPTTRPVLTDTNDNESERQQPSSPIVMPDARRLFQTTAKKPNRECNEDTLKSKRSEHPSNTPNQGKQKKKPSKQQKIALTYNQDTLDTEEGGGLRRGYTVPNKKFEHRIRPVTFRGGEVGREEIYDSDDIGRHDQSVFDAAHNIFGHRDIKLGKVREGLLTNNFENLSRLHVEDIMKKHDSVDPIHLRVLISMDCENKSWSDDTQLIFVEQDGEESGLGVQKRKIMQTVYYELYAILVPNRKFKSLQLKQMQPNEFLRLFLDVSNDSNNTFELCFEGMPDDARIEFKLSDMVNYPGGLMIFGAQSSALRSYQSLFKDKSNVAYIHHIYRQFCLETRGDPLATFALMAAYHRKMSLATTETTQSVEKDTITDIMSNKITFIGPNKSDFFNRFDNLFKKALESSIAQFQNYNDPLIPEDILSEYMDEVKSSKSIGLVHVWQALSSMRAIRSNETRSEHLVHLKEMQVFAQLLSLARQADPQRLVHWALANALASYGWGIRNKIQNINAYWGNTCSTWARDEKMKALIANAHDKQTKKLSSCTALLISFDNVQRGQQLQSQRGGSGNDYLKATHQVSNEVRPYTNTTWDNKYVAMTYDEKQPIPSPSGFPKFESVNVDSISEVVGVFANLDSLPCVEEPDFSGSRVAVYDRLQAIAHILNERKRCFWVDNVYPDSGEFNDVNIKIMQKIVRSKHTRSFFEGAKAFRDKVTTKWNPEVGEITMSMMLGVSGLEEETGNQCGAHQLDKLYRGGILIEKSDGTWELAEGYEKRRMYLFGDCKTIENLAKFSRDLSNRKLSYDKAADQAAIFMDALEVVMDMPGDWHAGLAMLKSIYTLFYDGFLKPFQEALGWKRINIDVGGCYYQSCRLAGYVADELTRALMYEYASTYDALDEFSDDDECSDSYAAFVCKYAVGFKTFLNEMKASNDELRSACALYLTMYTQFRIFVDSYRSGDAVGILLGYNSFVPFWYSLGQQKYSEVVWSQNETLLRNNTFARYMEISRNRCVRVHHSNTGKRMMAQDEFLEIKNADLAEFRGAKNIESYARQGHFVGVTSRCKKSVTELYRIQRSASSTPKRSVEPSMIPEKQLLFEYFMKLEVPTHNNTRKYDSKKVYQTRAKLTTVLTRADAKEKTTSSSDHSYNRIYSSIQQIMSTEGEDADPSGNVEDEIDEDKILRSVRDNHDDDSADVNGDSSGVSEIMVDGRSIKYRKMHKKMLHNLELEGWKSIKALDLKELRESRVQRDARQSKVNKEIANLIKEQRRSGVGDVGQEVHATQPWKTYVQRARSDYCGNFFEDGSE